MKMSRPLTRIQESDSLSDEAAVRSYVNWTPHHYQAVQNDEIWTPYYSGTQPSPVDDLTPVEQEAVHKFYSKQASKQCSSLDELLEKMDE